MRTSMLGSIVLATLGVGGFAGAFVAARTFAPEPTVDLADPELARSVAALASDVDEVKLRLATLEQRPATAERIETPPSRGAASAAEPAPAVPPALADPAAQKAAAVAAAAKELAPRFERLALDGVPPDELKTLLGEVAKRGEQDAAIAAVKALIEAHPRDPKLRYLLAKATYARLMLESTPAGYEKWGDLTVAAWDQALDLDPDYWEPRFERAEYFTYFPESEGKTPEVISEFEKLIAKQGGSIANPRFARSYAHLSRMYLRVGKRDKAIQLLRDGSALFPDDPELRKQLEVLRGN